MRIFVQIASYRDPELVPTIEHCLSRAKYPENLTFGICCQYDNPDQLKNYLGNKQFKIVLIPYQDSRGTCWARSQINNLYNEEEFTLQIDSHMRFVKDWDEKIYDIWKELQDSKAVLTSYPPQYRPDWKEDEWKKEVHIINVYNFKNRETEQRPKTPTGYQNRTTPYKAVHVAAGFIFGPGSIIKDVPYDPEFYFSGEETSLMVRLYTHGYNVYHPHKNIVWHYYARPDQPKHWKDCDKWGNYSSLAKNRLHCLLKRNTNYDLGKYCLGTERTLEDFIKYSGIDYNRNIVHLDTIAGKEPPVDLTDKNKWSYEKVKFKKIMQWNYDQIDRCDDPRFWAIIFKDKGNQEIYRKDLKYGEYKDIIDGKVTEMEFEFDYYSPAQEPAIFMIWPYSESKKWLKNKIWNIT